MAFNFYVSEQTSWPIYIAQQKKLRNEVMGQTSVKQKLGQRQVRNLQRHVSFSEDEIQEWYHEFCRSTKRRRGSLGATYLTEEEFCKVYNSAYPGRSDDFARHVFRSFDCDEDGRVDFREFLIGLSVSGSSDVSKQLAWAFSLYDIQGTGYIVREEMTQIIRAVFKIFGHSRLRHRGVALTPEALSEELFAQMDRDGDQRISWREFREGAAGNTIVLALLTGAGNGDGGDEGDGDGGNHMEDSTRNEAVS